MREGWGQVTTLTCRLINRRFVKNDFVSNRPHHEIAISIEAESWENVR